MRPTKVKAHKGNLLIFDIRLKNFVRQRSISAVCSPDRLESSSKFREISVCVTTYNRKAYGYTFRLGPVFQVILCLSSRVVTFHPPVSIFAKDGQQYICARRLSIAAIFAKFHILPIIIADWRCPLTGPTCCTSIDSSPH